MSRHGSAKDRTPLLTEPGNRLTTEFFPNSYAAAECPTCHTRVFPNWTGAESIGCEAHPDAETRRNAEEAP
jgi:hypothetical protein